uniref:Uncharacterized protein n=1 Tax=Ananas comosus var. bracteatus TaxID=296719 RepID=A0A6V7PZL9_ANACO|nr:unnamed protein product [Ananas comosus var. bracteatus]
MERYGERLWQLRKRKKRMIVPETAEDAECHGEMRVGDARKKGRSDSWKRFFKKFHMFLSNCGDVRGGGGGNRRLPCRNRCCDDDDDGGNETAEGEKENPLFLSCFWGSSSVLFSDELQSSGRIKKKQKKKKKKQKAPWLSWWHVEKKKRKKTKMVPFESSNTTTTTSSPSPSSEALLEKCFHKKPTSRARNNTIDTDAQQTNTAAPQLREDVAAESPPQPLLPSTSTKPSAAQTGHSPDPIQTRILAVQPGPPRRSVCHTAPNHSPARTGRAAAGDSGAAGDRTDHNGVDLDSEEYKKRVIMEGLLERNGRRPSYAL